MTTDIVDLAQKFTVDQNLVAEKTICRQLEIQSLVPSLDFCMDCKDPIPEQRKAYGGIEYCTECQKFHS